MTELNLAGKTIAHFQILDELGQGAKGKVFKAYQVKLERVVALKVLLPSLTLDASYVARFQQEARRASRLEHSQIVPIFEIGSADQLHYIAMKYIEGKTLRDLMRQSGPLPAAQAIAILEHLAEAIDYAHSQGVIHRNIKPSNILLASDGRAYLSDFGLAPVIPRSGLTADTPLGTPSYLSPEQARGDEGQATADLYALAIVLYEMLTGTLPFAGDSPTAALTARLTQPPAPPSALDADFPRAIEDVLLRGLARDPQARYGSAHEIVEEIKAAGAAATAAGLLRPGPDAGPSFTEQPSSPQLTVALPPTESSPAAAAADSQQQAPPARRRRPLLIGAAILAIMLLTSVGLLALQPGAQEQAARHLEQAQASFERRGDLSDAIAEAHQALATDPRNVAAHTLLARLYQLHGQPHDAVESARKALEIEPDHALAHAWLAQGLLDTNEGLEQALQHAERAIALDPQLSLGYASRALILARRAIAAYQPELLAQAEQDADRAIVLADAEGRFYQAEAHAAKGSVLASRFRLTNDRALAQQAIEQYQRAISLQDQVASLHSRLGDFYNDLRRYDEARRAFGSALMRDHTYWPAHVGLGRALSAQKNYDEAIRAFAEAIELNPNDAAAYYGRALGHRDKAYAPGQERHGQLALALEDLHKAAELSPTNADYRLQLGYVLQSLGSAGASAELEAAIAIASDDLRHNSDNAFAQSTIGEAYLALGNYPEAIQALRRATRLNPSSAGTLYKLGRALYDSGDYQASVEAFAGAVALDDRSALYQEALGEAYYKTGQHHQAIETLNAALKLENNRVRSYGTLGQAYYATGAYQQAVPALRRAIGLDPGYAEYHNALGLSYLETGKYSLAERSFRTAIELEPGSPAGHYNLGRASYEQGRFEQAIDAFKTAIELDAQDADAHYWLARTYYLSVEDALALEAIQRAIELDRRQASYHYYHGLIASALDDSQAAINAFQLALALDSSGEIVPLAYKDLGTEYLYLQNYDQAIASFNGAINADPEYPSAYDGLGQAYLQKGQYARAIEALSIAIKLDPQSSDAHNRLGLAYLYEDQYANAVTEFKQALALDPEDANLKAIIHYNLGLTYHSQENHRAAISEFDQAIALKPSDGDFYFWKADSLFQQEGTNSACQTISEGLAMQPDHQNLSQLRSTLGCS